GGAQDRAPEQQQDHRLSQPAHSRTAPVAAPTRMAAANVVGANRSMKRRPKTPVCMAISLRSTIGPTTRNTRRDVSENCDSEAATKASASLQMDSSTASTARARIDS